MCVIFLSFVFVFLLRLSVLFMFVGAWLFFHSFFSSYSYLFSPFTCEIFLFFFRFLPVTPSLVSCDDHDLICTIIVRMLLVLIQFPGGRNSCSSTTRVRTRFFLFARGNVRDDIYRPNSLYYFHSCFCLVNRHRHMFIYRWFVAIGWHRIVTAGSDATMSLVRFLVCWLFFPY